jgi:membrane protease YdiL (CAAX protease family)
MALALLLVSLAALAWFQRRDVRKFAQFRAVEDSVRRQRIFLRWAGNACGIFLGISLLGLALLGRLDAIWAFPEELWDVAMEVPWIDTGSAMTGGLIGAGIGCAIVVVVMRLRRGRSVKPPAGMDITPLLPRNRAELLHLLPLVLNAGISEEIFFRVYLPLLMVLAGTNGWVAFGISGVIFGAMHRYQGWLGVAVTTVLGALFTFLYLGGGGLLLPVALHLVINANSLLLRPALQWRFRRPAD